VNRPAPPVIGRDDGSASVELAIVAPGLLLLLALVVAAGRVALAGGAIEQVATAAARSASIARTADQAHQSAVDTAQRVLGEQRLACQHTSIDVDTSGFQVPPGQPAQVRVEVVCVVSLDDLALPGLPGTKALRSSFTSPLDPHRGRS
jgi:Flp pilus assembly protein TadG